MGKFYLILIKKGGKFSLKMRFLIPCFMEGIIMMIQNSYILSSENM